MASDAVFNTAPTQILFTCVLNTSSPLPFRPDAREVRSSSLLVLLPPLPPLSRGPRRCFPALLTPGLFHQALSFVWGGGIGVYNHPCLFTISAIKGQTLSRRSRRNGLQMFSAPKTILRCFPLERGSEVLPSPGPARIEMPKPTEPWGGDTHTDTP